MLNSEMTKLTLKGVELVELNAAVQKIIHFADNTDVWVFEGQMGAGKTTLIKEICNQYEVHDNVTSPTFSIVNEYMNGANEMFYHFDFYRIEKENEAVDIGCEEYFYSENKCFIEWPSKIPNLLPDDRVEIRISIEENLKRSINVMKHA